MYSGFASSSFSIKQCKAKYRRNDQSSYSNSRNTYKHQEKLQQQNEERYQNLENLVTSFPNQLECIKGQFLTEVEHNLEGVFQQFQEFQMAVVSEVNACKVLVEGGGTPHLVSQSNQLHAHDEQLKNQAKQLEGYKALNTELQTHFSKMQYQVTTELEQCREMASSGNSNLTLISHTHGSVDNCFGKWFC